jgi:hypothetical protein
MHSEQFRICIKPCSFYTIINITMTNKLLIICYIFVFASCNEKSSHPNMPLPQKEITKQDTILKTSPPSGMVGTWVSSRPNQFQIVEILDSSNATVSAFQKWQTHSSSKSHEKLGYYKFKGKLTVTYGCNIAIQTDQFRFIYLLVKDTLFQMAEPGQVDTLVKVYTDSVIEKE